MTEDFGFDGPPITPRVLEAVAIALLRQPATNISLLLDANARELTLSCHNLDHAAIQAIYKAAAG